MSDDPLKWTAHDAPPGITEFVRSLERPPPLPPEIRASVRRSLVRRISPLRWIGPTSVAAVVVAGITLWILGPKFPTDEGERHDIVAALDPIADAGVVDARAAHVGSLTPEVADIPPELRRDLNALGYGAAPGHLGAPPDSGAPRIANGPDGRLMVRTTPSAHVLVDGADTGPNTPLNDFAIAGGSHALDLVTMDGTHHEETIDVSAGETLRIVRRLTTPHPIPVPPPQPVPSVSFTAQLNINSHPWSRVYVDGDLTGNTPIARLLVSPGHHVLDLVTSDGTHHRTTVDLQASETVNVVRSFDDVPASAPALAGFGTLRINSVPWAQVFVDGRLVGNTPIVGLELSPGLHRVTLVNDSLPARQNIAVNIRAGQVQTQNVQLSAQAAPDNPF